MRHFMIMTASILAAGFILSTCGQDVHNRPAPDTLSSDVKPQSPEGENRKTANNNTTFIGWNMQGLTPSEQEEYIALGAKIDKVSQDYAIALKAWKKQDPASRGPRSKVKRKSLPKDESDRFWDLYDKVKLTKRRKKYETFVPEFLSQVELDEFFSLEQARSEFLKKQTDKHEKWREQSSASRGPRPEILTWKDFAQKERLDELDLKIFVARKTRGLEKRDAEIRAKYNISLTENELEELLRLKKQNHDLNETISSVMDEALKENTHSGQSDSTTEAFNKVPRHLLLQTVEIEQRIREINAPLKDAQEAEKVRQDMARASARSGVIILSSDIDEVIALNAERRRIDEKADQEAYHTWRTEKNIAVDPKPIYSDADYARIKEIKARIKEIYSPKNEVRDPLPERR